LGGGGRDGEENQPEPSYYPSGELFAPDKEDYPERRRGIIIMKDVKELLL
jgi:hypothetical protein